jgi:nuclear pore complex protein Nup93
MLHLCRTLLSFQLITGQPVWARLYYMVRTGNIAEALEEATRYRDMIERRESGFVSHFKTWLDSPDRR